MEEEGWKSFWRRTGQSCEDTSYMERCWKSVQDINRFFKFLSRDGCCLSPTADIFIFFIDNSGILPLEWSLPQSKDFDCQSFTRVGSRTHQED